MGPWEPLSGVAVHAIARNPRTGLYSGWRGKPAGRFSGERFLSVKAIRTLFHPKTGLPFPAWLMTLCLIGVALLALQFAVGTVLDSLWFARPTDVAAVLVEWFTGGSIYPHLATTLIELGLGFAFGIVIAIILAMVLSSNQLLGQVAMPSSMPPIPCRRSR